MDLPRVIAKLFFVSVLAAGSGNAATEAPKETQPGRPLRFHDPSTPVRQGSTWCIFSTGNGILIRYSRDLKTWTPGEPVFKEQELPAWHRQVVPENKGHLWAPDVIRSGNRYLLYYSVSGWGKNTSAIGLASSPTLDPKDPEYRWRDDGIVIQSKPKDSYNAIDPQLFADPDGKLWMVFGSFWSGIQLIELDPKTGLRHPENTKVKQLAWNETIEAAAILRHGDYYHLFVNWGLCCKGVNSTYEIRVGRSKKITGPYLDAEGKDLATGGGTLLLGSQGDRIGPGHPSFVTGKDGTKMFIHYYDRQRAGSAVLGEIPLQWTADGWPKL